MSIIAKVAKKVGDGVRSKDNFGIPITLNFKGDDTYKTLCGGCTTLTLLVFILAFSTQQILVMVNR